MPNWNEWAEKALTHMDENNLTGEEYKGDILALRHIQDTGYEPYITLKAFVYRMYANEPDEIEVMEASPELRQRVKRVLQGFDDQ